MTAIYYSNWKDEAELPMANALTACGVKWKTLVRNAKERNGCLAIVHHGDIRASILDRKEIPNCLINNAIIVIASTEGVKIEPETLKNSEGLHCHVFGIGRAPKRASERVHFLTNQEWSEIIQWATESKQRASLNALKQSATEAVKKLLWPDDDERRGKMALAVLCQGFLFCLRRQAAKKDLGEDVIKALQIMKCSEDQRASAEQRKEITGMWESVQNSEWWLRVFRQGDGGKALMKSERANALKVITELLGKEAKALRDSTKLASMLENGKVNDVNVVARVFIRLQKELA